MKLLVKSPAGMRATAREFLEKLSPRRDQACPPGRAVVVGLCGDLGSGKTTFVQAVGAALGIKEPMASPTFVIIKVYDLPLGQKFKQFIHIDAYRLENAQELAVLDFQSLLADPANLIFIEWAERVAELLPPNHHRLNFEFVNQTTRRLTSN